jgi:guanylate kinase
MKLRERERAGKKASKIMVFDFINSNKKFIGAAAAAALVGLFFLRSRGGHSSRAARRTLDAIVIAGPSGVGKGTMIKRLRSDYPSLFGFSVSHTTRAPRAGEVDGKDYHFVDTAAMEAMIARGEFLESCKVHSNIYGTSKASLEAVRSEGKVCIIEMDVQGTQKLRPHQGELNFKYLFFTAPTEAELERRIRGRGADDDAKLKERMDTARKELHFVNANPNYFDMILLNDNLDEAYAKLLAFLRKNGVAV